MKIRAKYKSVWKYGLLLFSMALVIFLFSADFPFFINPSLNSSTEEIWNNSFDVKSEQNKIVISANLSQLKSYHVFIEKSTNGLDFKNFQQIPQNELTENFIFYDTEQTGTVYYRLKLKIDDDNYKFSEVVAYTQTQEKTNVCSAAITPNPCIGKCNIVLENCDTTNMHALELNIFDAFGNIIPASVEKNKIDKGKSLNFNEKNYLSPGVYFVKGSKKKFSNKKVIIQY